MNLSNRGIRPLTAQESNEGEYTGQTVKSEADEKPSTFRDLRFARHRLPKAACSVFRINSAPVPVDITSLPSSELLLVRGWEERECYGCCGKGGDQSHDDEDGKGTLTQDLCLETDVLNQSVSLQGRGDP